MFRKLSKFGQTATCAVVGFFAVIALAPSSTEGAVITGLTAEWIVVEPDPTGPGFDTSDASPGSPGETASIFWGMPAYDRKRSGYKFNPVDDPTEVVAGEMFSLGKFQHLNYPIYAPFLETATLNLSGLLDGNPFDLTFTVNHNETPNIGWRCCDDIVSIGDPDLPLAFKLNDYIFTVLGFRVHDEYPNPIFTTKEWKTNKAYLIAKISPVPLPATLPLFGAGLGILGFVGWRRRRQKMPRKTSA